VFIFFYFGGFLCFLLVVSSRFFAGSILLYNDAGCIRIDPLTKTNWFLQSWENKISALAQIPSILKYNYSKIMEVLEGLFDFFYGV